MSSLVIHAVSVFEIPCGKSDRQTVAKLLSRDCVMSIVAV